MSWTADEAYLAHHGIKGQRWGVRRYQEDDGDYTAAGKARYGIGNGQKKSGVFRDKGDTTKKKKGVPDKLKVSNSDSKVTQAVKKDYNNMDDREFMRKYATSKKEYAKRVDKYGDPYTKGKAAQIGKKLGREEAENTEHFGQKGKSYGINVNKAANFEKEMNRRIEISKEHDKAINTRMANKQAKIEAKYDKKAAKQQANIDALKSVKNGVKDKKGNVLLTKDDVKKISDGYKAKQQKIEAKKEAKIGKQRDKVQSAKAGQKRYNDTMRQYRNAGLKSLENEAYKGNPKYKQAVQNYAKQELFNELVGTSAVKSGYAVADSYKRKHGA